MAISNNEIESFWNFAVFDDEGLCGVRDDAPEEAKAAYESFVREQTSMLEQGIR